MLENRYLFRGKRVDNGEWVYGDLIHTPEGKTRIIWFEPMYSDDIHFYKDYNFMVDKETIGQFIGLTDKNGVKVFEGDILKGGIYSRYVIEWDSYNCEFNIHAFNVDLFEIIGNIHE